MSAARETTDKQTQAYLPDFCDGDVFLRLLLVVELIAIAFALVSYGGGRIFVHIALISVVWRLLPSRSSQSRVWSRPSM